MAGKEAKPRPVVDDKWAPPEGAAAGFETQSQDDRALALGDDSAGGYLVPKQLDGTRPGKKRK